MTHLLISGGIYHDFDASSAALASTFDSLGLRTTVCEEPEEALERLAAGGWALLTINALRFSMTQDEKYAPFRAQWAYTLPARARTVLAAYVAGGGALLGLHTASICFDGWDEWAGILGAGWEWGHSSHPPAGRVEVEVIDSGDDLTAGCVGFEVHDEVYRGLRLAPGVRALLRARAAGDDEYHPVMWAHRYGAGRVVYDALGHGPDSVGDPAHRAILQRAGAWLVHGHA